MKLILLDYLKEVDSDVFDSSFKEIALAVRQKIKQNLQHGKLPDKEVFYLYHLYDKVDIEKDDFLHNQYSAIANNLAEFTSFDEQLFAYNALFMLQILNGNPKKGYQEYLQNIFSLSIHTYSEKMYEFMIGEYIPFVGEGLAFYLHVLKDELEFSHFTSLSTYRQRNVFNYTLQFLYSAKIASTSKEWKLLYEPLKKILFYYVEHENVDMALYLQFFIYHLMGNVFTSAKEWKEYNEQINKPLGEFYKKWSETNLEPFVKPGEEKAKKKIVFLKERVVDNSPTKVELSLFEALMNDEEFEQNYELNVYDMHYIETSDSQAAVIQKYKNLGITYKHPVKHFMLKDGYYVSHLEKAKVLRKALLEEEIDTLITSCNGYGIANLLLAARVAPTQVYWSHGDFSFDTDGIDKRISHFTQESDFTFENFTLPVDIKRYDPPIDKDKLAKERAKYPKDAFILGVIGRLVKVDSDEYLETVATIMKENPNTIYIAAGAGNKENIKQKVKDLGIADRFYMPGFVDPHVYGHIIDVWLDTFPLHQGESRVEFVTKGKPFVKLIPTARKNYQKLSENEYKQKVSKKSILGISGFLTQENLTELEKALGINNLAAFIFLTDNKASYDLLTSNLKQSVYLINQNKFLQFADYLLIKEKNKLIFDESFKNLIQTKGMSNLCKYFKHRSSFNVHEKFKHKNIYETNNVMANACIAHDRDSYIARVDGLINDHTYRSIVKDVVKANYLNKTIKKSSVKQIISILL